MLNTDPIREPQHAGEVILTYMYASNCESGVQGVTPRPYRHESPRGCGIPRHHPWSHSLSRNGLLVTMRCSAFDKTTVWCCKLRRCCFATLVKPAQLVRDIVRRLENAHQRQ